MAGPTTELPHGLTLSTKRQITEILIKKWKVQVHKRKNDDKDQKLSTGRCIFTSTCTRGPMRQLGARRQVKVLNQKYQLGNIFGLELQAPCLNVTIKGKQGWLNFSPDRNSKLFPHIFIIHLYSLSINV